jgi:NitT/TauT family transport system ATP-binding protein
VPRLEILGVSKVFTTARRDERVEALRDVTLEIADGEFVAILGPSGCGKSTLLNVAAGFEEPTGGRATLDGVPITRPGPERGMMFQDYALFPWKTVADNVAFGPKARRIPPVETARIVGRYIETVGLHGFENKYPHELSGGMRQRCALARLLANDPAVLLMDEPLAALDEQTRRIMQDELLRVWGEERPRSERKTVMYVTHSIEEAVLLSDRIVVMSSRPGTVLETIGVDLPRPRSGQRTAARFAELTERTWNLVKEGAYRAVVAGA